MSERPSSIATSLARGAERHRAHAHSGRAVNREPARLAYNTMCYGAPLQSAITTMKRLLIVDDSKLMRDMVAACLRPLGAVAFEFAASGLEALERLALAHFDLMVLDLNMPDVGGIEVVEFVRAQDRLRALPILIVTTRGDDDSRARSLDAGASSFLAKPFAPSEILDQVRRLFTPEGAIGRAPP
jgi:two-component system, chemotaxis family, chemotaxis protein CheY